MDPSLPTNQGGEKVQELEQKLAEMKQQTQPQEPVTMATPQPVQPSQPAVPVVEPTSPSPTLPKSPSTSLPVLIVLFLLVALATGGYYLASMGIVNIPGISPTATPVSTPTPSPDPTANWQVYTNKVLGFEFKHPSQIQKFAGGVSGPNNGNPQEIAHFADMQTVLPNSDAPFDGFSVYSQDAKSLKGITFDDYLKDERNSVVQNPRASMPSAVIQTVKLGDNLFSFINSETNITRYFIQSPDKQNIIIFSRINQTKPFLQVFDQILSTFKFNSSTPSTDISTWKNYLNGAALYEVKYPNTWRVVESQTLDNKQFVGFGPKEVAEDVLWMITVYSKKDNTKASIMAEVGKQFTDRKQTSQTINLNGVNATLVTTTTPSTPDWYSQIVITEQGDSYFVISNGAVNDTNLQKIRGVPSGTTFKGFYSTFKFTN